MAANKTSVRSMIMAETTSLVSPTKTYRTLDGHVRGEKQALLNLANVYSAVLWEEKDDAVAFAAVISYAPGKAYACVSEVSPDLIAKQVRVVAKAERQGNEQIMQISKHKDGLRDPLLEPLWKTHLIRKSRTAHENVIDLAVGEALGTDNLELTKNVTVDIIESDVLCGEVLKEHLAVWRDRVGFIVGDQRDFFEIVIDAAQVDRFSKLLLAEADDGKVPQYPVKAEFEEEDLCVYDKKVTGLVRTEYLQFLRALPNSEARMAYSADGGGIPCGTSFVFDGTLMHLYAESDGAAIALLHATLSSWPKGTSFTCAVQRDTLINKVATGMTQGVTIRRVHRFHTTGPPSSLAWDNVYAFNAGVHIV